jgi:acetate kinase
MEFFGIKIDEELNIKVNKRGVETDLSLPGTKTKVYLIPTDEELVIAATRLK